MRAYEMMHFLHINTIRESRFRLGVPEGKMSSLPFIFTAPDKPWYRKQGLALDQILVHESLRGSTPQHQLV